MDDNTILIIPTPDKPVKIVFENDVSIEDNGDMTLTIKRPATLKEIAEWLDVPIDDVFNCKIGIYNLEELK